MRLPLLAAALAAAAATALPADAALYPVCGTALAATAAGQSKSCTTGNTPQLSSRANRRFDVTVTAGTVDARITCNHPTGAVSQTVRLTAPAYGVVRVVERVGYSCVGTLTAVSDVAAAAGVSTYTPILVDPYPVP